MKYFIVVEVKQSEIKHLFERLLCFPPWLRFKYESVALRDQFCVNRSAFDSVQAEAHLRSANKSENLISTDLITLWHKTRLFKEALV